mgnify:CR=1 FL=1
MNNNKKLDKICMLLDKLPKGLKEDFCNLNYFQIDKIISLKKISPQSAKKILKIDSKVSKAQKYRYLKELVDLKFIKKKHNHYYQ